jgi:hypothetical protein
VDQQADIETTFVDLANDRVDQERHVVVDDFKYRYARLRRCRLEANFRRVGLALLEQRPRLLGDARQFLRPVAHKVFRSRSSEQVGDEVLGDVGVALGEHRGGGLDHRRPGAVGAGGRRTIEPTSFRPVLLPSRGCDFGPIVHGTRRSSLAAFILSLLLHRN